MTERTAYAAAGLRAAPRAPAEPAAAILHSSGQRPFQSAPLSAVATRVLTFTAAWTGSRASRRGLEGGGGEWKIKHRKEGFGDRVMLSAQGYHLCHLHRDPIRGWRGRLSEGKFSTLGPPNPSSTSGTSAAQSAPALLPATNPRRAVGRDQGKGPSSVEAWPSRRSGSSERWGRAEARCEAIVF